MSWLCLPGGGAGATRARCQSYLITYHLINFLLYPFVFFSVFSTTTKIAQIRGLDCSYSQHCLGQKKPTPAPHDNLGHLSSFLFDCPIPARLVAMPPPKKGIYRARGGGGGRGQIQKEAFPPKNIHGDVGIGTGRGLCEKFSPWTMAALQILKSAFVLEGSTMISMMLAVTHTIIPFLRYSQFHTFVIWFSPDVGKLVFRRLFQSRSHSLGLGTSYCCLRTESRAIVRNLLWRCEQPRKEQSNNPGTNPYLIFSLLPKNHVKYKETW